MIYSNLLSVGDDILNLFPALSLFPSCLIFKTLGQKSLKNTKEKIKTNEIFTESNQFFLCEIKIKNKKTPTVQIIRVFPNY